MPKKPIGNRNQLFQVLVWNRMLVKTRDHKVQMTELQVSNTYPLVPIHVWLHLIHLTSDSNTLKYLGWSQNLVPKSLTLQMLCWHNRASNLCNPWGIKTNRIRYSNTPCENQVSEVKWSSIKVWEKAKQSKGLPRCISLKALTKVS